WGGRVGGWISAATVSSCSGPRKRPSSIPSDAANSAGYHGSGAACRHSFRIVSNGVTLGLFITKSAGAVGRGESSRPAGLDERRGPETPPPPPGQKTGNIAPAGDIVDQTPPPPKGGCHAARPTPGGVPAPRPKPGAAALHDRMPVVALESSLITHGLPWPVNLETALAAEEAVRASGAVPATIAIIDGEPIVGVRREEIERLARAHGVLKASRRDIAA